MFVLAATNAGISRLLPGLCCLISGILSSQFHLYVPPYSLAAVAIIIPSNCESHSLLSTAFPCSRLPACSLNLTISLSSFKPKFTQKRSLKRTGCFILFASHQIMARRHHPPPFFFRSIPTIIFRFHHDQARMIVNACLSYTRFCFCD